MKEAFSQKLTSWYQKSGSSESLTNLMIRAAMTILSHIRLVTALQIRKLSIERWLMLFGFLPHLPLSFKCFWAVYKRPGIVNEKLCSLSKVWFCVRQRLIGLSGSFFPQWVDDNFGTLDSPARMPWLVKHGSPSCFLALKHLKAHTLTHIRRACCVKTCIPQRSPGFLCAHSKVSISSSHISLTACLRRWTYGANRAQIDADVKVLAEFLSYLQNDIIRGSPEISSLSPAQLPSRSSCE